MNDSVDEVKDLGQIIELLEEIVLEPGRYQAHGDADWLLCETLRALIHFEVGGVGIGEDLKHILTLYNLIPKWYS
jgi:hypothetical protein